MHVLVVNAGSSSLKLCIVEPATGARAAESTVERIPAGGHQAALEGALPALLASGGVKLAAVGHRVVHGGELFTSPTHLDDAVTDAIRGLIPLAPLHVPANLAGVAAARAVLPDVPHVAVFDTAFHATLPNRARRYALPLALAEKHGIRRYGFHGPSHKYVAERAAEHLGAALEELRIITCHLGNGASATAVEYGRSVETSMGMTPLEGLVMGTRSGDVDPGVLLHLVRQEGLDADGLDRILNKESGLAGLSGIGNDMRDIEEAAANGDDRCRAALHAFCHRLRKYIGAYAAVMGGVDAIVFTAGIGENSALVRHRTAQRLEFLGARLDEELNRDCEVTRDAPVVEISPPHARCRILVVKTDEAHAIARDVARMVLDLGAVGAHKPIPIAVSARHVHLTQDAVKALFGPDGKLTPRKWLSQPGQFACEERVTLHGPRGSIERVGIIGPVRRDCQIEVSRTDEYALGLDAPIRRSGQVANSPGITLQGPAGRLTLEEGVVQAWRHIHMQPEDAEHYGVKDGDVVSVAVDSEARDLVFGDVLVRVKSSYLLEMHIDTDEANAADLNAGDAGMLALTRGTVRLLRKDVTHAEV